MRAVVVYESMFGNTHTVADQIAEGMRPTHEVVVVPVSGATADVLDGVELLVVGGPTHVHGMSNSTSRAGAVDMAAKEGADLELDPDHEGEGLRDWFHHLPKLHGARAAAFDTRIGSVGPLVSGRASKGIAKRLRHHGFELVTEPESFLVDKDSHLVEGEALRARQWGEVLR
jgi:Flavodoxin